MGKKWSNLDADQRSLFMKAANQDKRRYEEEMKIYSVHGAKGKNIQDYDAQRPKK